MSTSPVHEGEEITPLEMTPDIQHVRAYFGDGASQTFFFNDDAAKAQGLPGRPVPGPLKVGILYGAVENWLGDRGYVRAVRAAHRRPDVQGNPIVVVGTVARVFEEDGKQRADIELNIINKDGQPSVRGSATVEFWS